MILKQQTIIDHQGVIELQYMETSLICIWVYLKIMYNYTGRTYNWLVVLTILKNMSSSMGLGWHPIYEIEHNPVMFETTNQHIRTIYSIVTPQKNGSVSKPCTPGEHQNSW